MLPTGRILTEAGSIPASWLVPVLLANCRRGDRGLTLDDLVACMYYSAPAGDKRNMRNDIRVPSSIELLVSPSLSLEGEGFRGAYGTSPGLLEAEMYFDTAFIDDLII